MTRSIRTCALVCGLALILFPHRTAAQSGVLDEVLRDWMQLKESTLQLADSMPAQKYNSKPPFPVRIKGVSVDTAQESFGKRVLFIAIVNVRWLGILDGKAKAPAIDDSEEMPTKEAAMAALTQSFDYGLTLLKEWNDQTILQRVQASFLGLSSRARVFAYLQSHTKQIDGQLALYLRFSEDEP